MSESVLELVKTIIHDRIGIDEAEITLEATFADTLACDDLDMVEIVMECEDEFDIEINDEEAYAYIEDNKTVGDLVSFITANQS
jgi:acyl carrier protein